MSATAARRLRVRTDYFEHHAPGGFMRWAGAHVRSATAARPREWMHAAILAITIGTVAAAVLSG